MFSAFALSLLFILAPALIVSRRQVGRFPLALALNLGFQGVLASISYRWLEFGWAKIALVGTLSTGLLEITFRWASAKDRRPLSLKSLFAIAALAGLLVLDNGFVSAHQGWHLWEPTFFKSGLAYFRGPFNNDVQRNVVLVSALLHGTGSPFLAGHEVVYQLFWHHLCAVFVSPFTGPTLYPHVLGCGLATAFVFFFSFFALLFRLRPAIFQRPLPCLLLALVLGLHAELFNFLESILLTGQVSIIAIPGHPHLNFFRYFPPKFVTLIAPQHAVFLLFALPFFQKDCQSSRLESLLFILAFLASPTLSVLFFPLVFAWRKAFVQGAALFVAAAMVFWGVMQLSPLALFTRVAAGGTEWLNLRPVTIAILPLAPVAIFGAAGIMLAVALAYRWQRKDFSSLRSEAFAIVAGGGFLFHYGITSIEIRRHFSLIAGVVMAPLLVEALPGARRLLDSRSWLTALKVTAALTVVLHAYYLVHFTALPSTHDASIPWKDYFAMNARVTGPTAAATDPRSGIILPIVMETAPSLSHPDHIEIHTRIKPAVEEVMKKIWRDGTTVNYAELLGYRAILWGPLEQRVWGERVKRRFIDERGLLARTGSVSLYRLEDKLRLKADTLEDHLGLAEELSKEHWLFEAMDHYHRALELAPQSGRAHVGLASVLQELGFERAAWSHRADASVIK